MKKGLAKLKKSDYIFILLFSGSVFFLIINFIPEFVIDAGLTAEFGSSISRDYSTYVNQSDPNTNYYDYYYSECIGNCCETYIHFNLERLPKETEQLYFSVRNYIFVNYWDYPPPVEDVEINIILIEESWNVSEITWNNKPKHGDIIKIVNISKIVQGNFIEKYDFLKAVEVTEIFKKNEITMNLCINLTENNEYLNTTLDFSPILLWNYEKVILSYTNIISSSVIFLFLIGTILLLRKQIYTCPNCGTKKVHKEISCFYCETVFELDQLNKRSDYQLILILLWTFIFFEVLYLIIVSIVTWLIYYQLILSLLLGIIWMIIYYKVIKKKIELYKDLKV
jgi:hypothetical protein